MARPQGRAAFVSMMEAPRPLFNLLGPPPHQKRFALFEGGHIPRLQDIIREMLDWLDRYPGRSRLPDAHRGRCVVL